MKYKIPFNRPFIVGKELDYIASAVTNGRLSGDGTYTHRCQEWLESQLGCTKALLTHSCTAALEMAALLCNIKPGDEVIMPSFTFVSTANAFALRGATPVFVDIKPDTLCLDETALKAALTRKTKAVVPVHYAGNTPDMDVLLSFSAAHDLKVVEDAAQALLCTDQDRYLGTLGQLGAISFHETKNIISGEGGALLINDPKMVEKAEIVWEKGTNRKRFFRGEVDKYTWVDLGSSYLPSELTAAFLWAQLEAAEQINTTRRQLWDRYREKLQPLAQKGVIELPLKSSPNGHLFYILTDSLATRTDLINHLKGLGILAVFHYMPLHQSPAGLKFGRVSGSLPVTEDISNRLLRLPLYYEMTLNDVDQVVEQISAFYQRR